MKSINPKNDIKSFPLRLPKWMFVELAKKSAKTMYSINLLIVEAINKDLKK